MRMKPTVESILRSLNQIRKVYAAKVQKQMREEHLSLNEISILILLANNPHITTAAQLCVVLGVSKGLISRSVERLVSRGILNAAQDEKDHRIVHLTISAQANELILRLNHEIDAINRAVLSDVSEAEILQMEATIRKITACFQKEEEA